jgi:methyl-accepting chemotaxis protein
MTRLQASDQDDELNALGRFCVGLFRSVDNVRMFKVGHLITVLTVLLLLAGVGATVLTFSSVGKIASVWRDFDSGLARRIDLLNHFEHHLGYAGLAGHWPAAAAGDQSSRQAIREDIAKVREGIPAYRLTQPGEVERAQLDALDTALNSTESALSTSQALDRKAIGTALAQIKESLQAQRKNGADAVEDAIWTLSATVGGVMALACLFLLAFGLFSFWFIRFPVAQPLKAINLTMRDLARGDTRINVPFVGKEDEIGEMARAVQVFKENAIAKSRMETQKQDVTQRVNLSTHELATLTNTVRDKMKEQSSSTASMSAATEQLTVSIDQVAQNAGSALALTQETVDAVTEGSLAVRATIGAMETTSSLVGQVARKVQELGQQSEQIQAIVLTIQGIAKRTDLLALNAAIEAARAGEAGSGFAVVADDVRKLAEKANVSARDIRTILASIHEHVVDVSSDVAVASSKAEESATQSRQVEHALRQIEERSARMASAVEEIANAANEQSSSGHEIARQVETVAELSESTYHLIGNIDNLVNDLSQSVAKL